MLLRPRRHLPALNFFLFISVLNFFFIFHITINFPNKESLMIIYKFFIQLALFVGGLKCNFGKKSTVLPRFFSLYTNPFKIPTPSSGEIERSV